MLVDKRAAPSKSARRLMRKRERTRSSRESGRRFMGHVTEVACTWRRITDHGFMAHVRIDWRAPAPCGFMAYNHEFMSQKLARGRGFMAHVAQKLESPGGDS